MDRSMHECNQNVLRIRGGRGKVVAICKYQILTFLPARDGESPCLQQGKRPQRTVHHAESIPDQLQSASSKRDVDCIIANVGNWASDNVLVPTYGLSEFVVKICDNIRLR